MVWSVFVSRRNRIVEIAARELKLLVSMGVRVRTSLLSPSEKRFSIETAVEQELDYKIPRALARCNRWTKYSLRG